MIDLPTTRDLGRLPHAREEARQIAALLPPDRVALFTDAEASESAFKRHPAVQRADILHLATHAVISDRSVGESALLLASSAEAGEDGLLQTREIFGLQLPARLVVLSGCETGLGTMVHGEGLVGLTQAFLGAGAEQLVVSLWRVADRSTADLMVALYRELTAAPGDAAAALRRVQLRQIDGGELDHPYYWAPFVTIGGWPRGLLRKP